MAKLNRDSAARIVGRVAAAMHLQSLGTIAVQENAGRFLVVATDDSGKASTVADLPSAGVQYWGDLLSVFLRARKAEGDDSAAIMLTEHEAETKKAEALAVAAKAFKGLGIELDPAALEALVASAAAK
jgi:hypothetical protein